MYALDGLLSAEKLYVATRNPILADLLVSEATTEPWPPSSINRN